MTNENLVDIVQRLMLHVVVANPEESQQDLPTFVTEPEYRSLVAHKILEMIEMDTYEYVVDFEWIVGILLELAAVDELDLGNRLQDVLIDVCFRVPDVREYAVGCLVQLFSQLLMDR